MVRKTLQREADLGKDQRNEVKPNRVLLTLPYVQRLEANTHFPSQKGEWHKMTRRLCSHCGCMPGTEGHEGETESDQRVKKPEHGVASGLSTPRFRVAW